MRTVCVCRGGLSLTVVELIDCVLQSRGNLKNESQRDSNTPKLIPAGLKQDDVGLN